MSTDPHYSSVDPSRPGPLETGTPEPPLVGGSAPTPPPENAVHFTRAAALWSALIVGFLVLVVLLIFIAQNTDPGTFHFLGWSWSLPLGVALLAAAVLGGLITTLAGVVRIVQLRRAAKKNYKAALR